VEVDASLADVEQHREHLLSLIHPLHTHMVRPGYTSLAPEKKKRGKREKRKEKKGWCCTANLWRWDSVTGLLLQRTTFFHYFSFFFLLGGRVHPLPLDEASHLTKSRSVCEQDLNIGAALWLAASGRGRVLEVEEHREPCTAAPGVCELAVVQGQGCAWAPVLLVGAGADEQCGGYARYRTRFKQGG